MIDTLVTDTLRIIIDQSETPINVSVLENENKWELWFLTAAILSLFLSVAIPISLKLYEEYKAKNSFHKYVKYYLYPLFNMIITDKVQQGSYEVTKNPAMKEIPFKVAVSSFYNDFLEHKYSNQPTVHFQLLFNLQNILNSVYRFRKVMESFDLHSIKEKTLAFGDKLNKKEISNLYGVIGTIEHFGTITEFNDKFDELQAVQRVFKKDIWVGVKTSEKMIKNQEKILPEDIEFIANNLAYLKAILEVCVITIDQLEKFYGKNINWIDTSIEKRKKK